MTGKKVLIGKTLYQLAVVTLLTSILWVSVAVYGALTKPADINVPKEISDPLQAAVDMELLRSLAEREQLSSQNLSFDEPGLGEGVEEEESLLNEAEVEEGVATQSGESE